MVHEQVADSGSPLGLCIQLSEVRWNDEGRPHDLKAISEFSWFHS
jgi:hypothetical protein